MTGLIHSPKIDFSPEQAQEHGMNVRAAMRTPELKKWLFFRVAMMSQRVDAGKRLESQEDYADAVDEIVSKVPTLTLEEIELVFRKIETGRIEIYNRLKIPEILKSLLDYDATTSQEVRERRMTSHRPTPFEVHERVVQKRKNSFLCLTETDLMEIAHETGSIKPKEET